MADLCSNVDLVLAHCMIQSIFYIYLGSFIIIFENDCVRGPLAASIDFLVYEICISFLFSHHLKPSLARLSRRTSACNPLYKFREERFYVLKPLLEGPKPSLDNS